MRKTWAAAALSAILLPGQGRAQTPTAADPSAVANDLFQAQDWDKASAAYAALARTPAQGKDPQVHFRLGVSLHALGRFAEAAAALETAERLGLPGFAAAFRLAKARARCGRPDDALAALRRAADHGLFLLSALDGDPDLAPLRAAAGFAEVRRTVERNARPCAHAPEYRALDFWIGDWEVRPTGAPPATPPSSSRVESIEDQCVILEQYTTAAGYSGRSLNVYDGATRRWEQFWVDNKGGIHHYRGTARDGNLYYEADGVHVPGVAGPVKLKMTFFNQGPDQVRQLGEQSTDGGQTWVTSYDLTYRRKAATEPTRSPS